ncbi:MAG: MarR family transcriptional regulator [Chloroflexi bacterium]|nr:MarR family transcriptional regulator [Chloroflexota bacterium]
MLNNEDRQFRVDRLLKRLKEDNTVRDRIVMQLKEGNKSVPEIAAAAGLDTAAVFWHIVAMRKYGKVAEAEMKGDYPSYRLVEEIK